MYHASVRSRPNAGRLRLSNKLNVVSTPCCTTPCCNPKTFANCDQCDSKEELDFVCLLELCCTLLLHIHISTLKSVLTTGRAASTSSKLQRHAHVAVKRKNGRILDLLGPAKQHKRGKSRLLCCSPNSKKTNMTSSGLSHREAQGGPELPAVEPTATAGLLSKSFTRAL